MNVSKKTSPRVEGSRSPSGITIIDRIAEAASAAEADPSTTTFAIASEAEAQNLLISLLAVLREQAKSLRHEDKAVMLSFVRRYLMAVNSDCALVYIRQAEEEGDPIYVYGLKIIISPVLAQLH